MRRLRFEVEPRWGGSLTTITRVVADRGTRLMSEGGHHGTVPIEDQAREVSGERSQELQPSIMGAAELDPQGGRSAREKPPKSLGIGDGRSRFRGD